ncbi:MAG: molybdenum cofactor biosynthesis protein MoaE [Actinomycetota bacterium]
MTEVTTGISTEPLDVSDALATASAPSCGALGIFVGTVRTSAAVAGNADKPVVRLEYEAHLPLADSRLRSIAEEAASKWDLGRITARHRIGACEVGEPTVVVACAAPHRADALEACRWIIDTIKSTVPIWKLEVYADGSSWLGAEGSTDDATESAT